MAVSGTMNSSPTYSSDNFNSLQPRRAASSIGSSHSCDQSGDQTISLQSESIAASGPSSISPISAAVIESASGTLAPLPVDHCSSENIRPMDKRPAWNKPSNGAAAEVKPVMDAASWPALSESTKATMKSSSESSKVLTDGSSIPQFQGTGSTLPSSQRQVGDNLITTNTVPTRQLSIKRNDLNPSSNGGHPQQSTSQASTAVTVSQDSSPKGPMQRSAFVPQPRNGHPRQLNSFMNRNGGAHQRGEGAHHHNYHRREQDRGNQGWNTHRSFTGRDFHMPARFVPRYIRHPPPPYSAQFVPPPPMRPYGYGGPFGFPEVAPPVVYFAAPPPLRTFPFGQPMPPRAVYYPPPDPHLHTKIVNQINYYFSNDNLVKDIFLRQNMDDQGWVPIKLIAGFNKVKQLTDNIQLILDALRASSVVEVQGDKIRRRNDWRKWILPPSIQFPSPRAFRKPDHETPTEKIQSIDLEKNTENAEAEAGAVAVAGGLDSQPGALQNKPTVGDLNSSLQLSGGEGTAQVSIEGTEENRK